jgi:hypothetical protein
LCSFRNVGTVKQNKFLRIYALLHTTLDNFCACCWEQHLYTRTHARGPFEKFVDSPHYFKSELHEGAVTVSFSKYLRWQAMHFLQRFSKTCCRPFAASFRKIV